MRLMFLLALLFFPLSAHAQQTAAFNLSSSILEEGGKLPLSAVYDANGCIGDNVSPALQWSGAPENAKSFTITMFDPDAPNGGLLHWAIFNIPGDQWSLNADAGDEKATLPSPAHTLSNSWGKKAYSGACPHIGEKHHYQFTIYAMRDALAFYPLSAIGKPTVNWLRDNSLAHTTMTVTYER